MINRRFFFDNARLQLFSGKLTSKQVEGLTALLDEWEENYKTKDDRWLAYMLATAHHETDRQMQPIEEYGKGKNYPYGKRLKMSRQPYSDTDQLFYGRGFVQLTWYENYDKAGKKLGQDFLHDAAKVMVLPNAVKVMFLGMTEGWFTGRKLADYFNPTTENWLSARKIINGTDKADLIKSHAFKYYSCISYTV